ncbi:hypothetical protein [Aeromicrobium flavum]|nr:hypothetical protein [Aeromicrobium flavum]
MRLRSIVLLLSSVVLIAGCGGATDEPEASPSTATPSASAEQVVEQVLRRHLVASDAGDCAAVKETVQLPVLVECADVREQQGQWSADGADLETVPVAVEITEDSATATVTWPSGEENEWALQDGGAGWRVLNVDVSDGV